MIYDYEYNDYKFSHKITRPTYDEEGFEKHFHTNYEMLYFLRGDIRYHIENKVYQLKKHDLLFIKPGEHHYVKLISDEQYNRMVFRFPFHAVPKSLTKIYATKKNIRNIKNTRLSKIFQRIDQYAKDYDGEHLQLLFFSILNEILIVFANLKTKNSDEIIMDETLKDILAYIHENINNPLTIRHICKKFYLSRSKLYQLFKSNLQVPIASYIRSKKLIHAHHLILNGQDPSFVYKQCGFQYYSTFYRAYIKMFGFSPSHNQTS